MPQAAVTGGGLLPSPHSLAATKVMGWDGRAAPARYLVGGVHLGAHVQQQPRHVQVAGIYLQVQP